MMRTVLFVAAEPFELRWIEPPGEDFRFLKVSNGPGPRLVREGMDRVTERIDVIVSTGLCGALDPSFGVGQIVVATAVNGEPATIPRTTASFRAGPVVSVDRVVGTAAEKKRLWMSGSVAVEMEAAAVAARARELGVPFYCVRAVSDTSSESFALDLNRARDDRGRFSVALILAQAVRRPLKIMPEMVRLRRHAHVAAKALGDFFADCDF